MGAGGEFLQGVMAARNPGRTPDKSPEGCGAAWIAR